MRQKRDRMLKNVLSLRPLLLSYITGFVGNLSDAEDVFQEAIIVVCDKYDIFAEGSNLKAWTFEISRRVALEWLRKHRSQDTILDAETLEVLASDAKSHEAAVSTPWQRDALMRCMGKLPKQARKLLEQRHVANHDCETIAKRLNRPVNSLYVSLTRIRARIRTCMEKEMAREALA